MKLSPRALLIYFSLIFVSGLLIRIFVSPILWPNIPEITDPGSILLWSAVAFLGLGVIYYLKTQGSPKQTRIFWTIAVAIMFAFPFADIGFLIVRALLESSGAALFFPIFVPLYFVGLIIGGAIGKWVGKRMETRALALA